METRRTCSHRGCSLSYFIEGDGPPVVWIHGTGVGGAAWRPQLDVISASYRCLAFDNRGFGRSTPLGEALTLELMARDVLALMDDAGWSSAHLVGHSLGGLIALYTANAARARVRSLALLNTFASGKVPTALSPWLIWAGLRTSLGTRRMRRRAFLEMILGPEELAAADAEALAERLGALFEHDLGEQPPISMKQLRAMGRADATPFLGALAGIPALVVSAEHDRIAPPAAARALALGLGGARHVELTGCSHAAPILRASEVNTLLLGHFDSAEQTWAAQAQQSAPPTRAPA